MLIEESSLIQNIESSETIIQEMLPNDFIGLPLCVIISYSDLDGLNHYLTDSCLIGGLIRNESKNFILRKYYRIIADILNEFIIGLTDGTSKFVSPSVVTFNISFFDSYKLKECYTIFFDGNESTRSVYDALVHRLYELSDFYDSESMDNGY